MSSTSSGDGSTLALKAPETAAKAARKPTNGWRPAAAKSSAAMGGRMMMPASAARWAIMPAKMTAAVSSVRGTPVMKARSDTAMSPVFSATPMPIMAVSTMPSGAKPMKLRTASVKMRRTPSAFKRLTAVMSEPSLGWTAEMPTRAASHEPASTTPARMTKTVMGSGSRLPTRSMPSSRRAKRAPPGAPAGLASPAVSAAPAAGRVARRRRLTARPAPLPPAPRRADPAWPAARAPPRPRRCARAARSCSWPGWRR